jgi:hypothetical protein
VSVLARKVPHILFFTISNSENWLNFLKSDIADDKSLYMKQKVRELLVTTKVAQNWQDNFEQKVDELMAMVNKIDTERQVNKACELLDVYHKSKHKPKSTKGKKQADPADKPFEFLVFRN